MKKVKVGLAKTNNRRENVFQALEFVKEDVIKKVKKEVVIKANFFNGVSRLATTHVDAVRGTIDFLANIPNPPKKVTIAASQNGWEFEQVLKNLEYEELPNEYDIPINFFNFYTEKEKVEAEVITNDGNIQKVRISKLIADSDCIISVAVAKTHDVCFATLGYKNVAVGAIHEPDRVKMHGFNSHRDRKFPEEMEILNINMIKVASYLQPHIAVIDGTVALQGNGPGGEDAVNFGIAAASVDVFAADTVVAKAMGFEPDDMGFLYYANKLGLGVTDLKKIKLLGKSIQDVAMKFKPHDRYEFQRQWKTDYAKQYLNI